MPRLRTPFTREWTRKCVPHWNAHLLPLAGTKPLTYLEIGVFEARSALWILTKVLTGPADRYFGVDPWDATVMSRRRFPPGDVGELRMRAVEQLARDNLAPFGKKAKLFKGRSADVLRDLRVLAEIGGHGSVDIAYVDGDHFPQPCLDDSRMVWGLVPVGGIVIWDDIKDPENHGANLFLREVPGRFELLFSDYQLGVRKTRE